MATAQNKGPSRNYHGVTKALVTPCGNYRAQYYTIKKVKHITRTSSKKKKAGTASYMNEALKVVNGYA